MEEDEEAQQRTDDSTNIHASLNEGNAWKLKYIVAIIL